MWEQLKRRSSYQALPTVEPKKDLYRDLHHPVFHSIRVAQVCDFHFVSALEFFIIILFLFKVRKTKMIQFSIYFFRLTRNAIVLSKHKQLSH